MATDELNVFDVPFTIRQDGTVKVLARDADHAASIVGDMPVSKLKEAAQVLTDPAVEVLEDQITDQSGMRRDAITYIADPEDW